MMESIEFVQDPDDEYKWHILLHDEDDLGLSLCGNGHAHSWNHWNPDFPLDLDTACVDCLEGVGLLAANMRRKHQGL